MLLSVIIPVYSVEPYLERCLSTVLACDLTDCEVLLSLGESTDRSNEICKDYAQRYPLIQTLWQHGTGLSDARNSAMEIARGRYVLFLDSDDFVDSARLDELIARLRDESFVPDVVMTDFRRLEQSTGRYVDVFQIGADMPEMSGIERLPGVIRKRQCFWNVWRYVYRRGFLEEKGISFDDGRMGEDVGFTTSVFLAEPEIVFLHCPFYIYEVGRADSLMGRPTLRRLDDTVWMLTDAIVRLRAPGAPFAPLMAARFQFEYILNMAIVPELPEGDRQAALALFADWRDVLGESVDPIVGLAGAVMGIFGTGLLSRALYGMKKARRWYKARRR